MLTIGGKDLKQRYWYPDNVSDVYLGIHHIWPPEEVGPTITGYGDWNIQLGITPTFIEATGGSAIIDIHCFREVFWSDGTTTLETAPGNLSFSTTLGTLDKTSATIDDTVKLTIDENTSTTARTAVITATYEGVSTTITCTQNPSESGPTYGDWTVSLSVDKTVINSLDTVTVTSSATRQVTYADGTVQTETGTPTLKAVGTYPHDSVQDGNQVIKEYSISNSKFTADSGVRRGTIVVTATMDTSTKSVSITHYGYSLAMNSSIIKSSGEEVTSSTVYVSENSGQHATIKVWVYRNDLWSGTTPNVAEIDASLYIDSVYIEPFNPTDPSEILSFGTPTLHKESNGINSVYIPVTWTENETDDYRSVDLDVEMNAYPSELKALGYQVSNNRDSYKLSQTYPD